MDIRSLCQFTQNLASVSENPRLEIELLLCKVLDVDRSYLYANPNTILSAHQITLFENLLIRRQIGEPLAYIMGKKEFWSFELQVTSDTLIPRPETELLVELTLDYLSDKGVECGEISVADLGTGSGAVAIALSKERPSWNIVATDTSDSALEIAKANATRLNCANIQFYQGNWCAVLPHQKFTAIVSNPPYIAIHDTDIEFSVAKFEPAIALFSGNGLDALHHIIQEASNYLENFGWLILEHGAGQSAKVVELLKKNQYAHIRTHLDLFGKARITVGQYLHS